MAAVSPRGIALLYRARTVLENAYNMGVGSWEYGSPSLPLSRLCTVARALSTVELPYSAC